MLNLKYIVTGTGRCATVYFARFLTSIGIPCGHESIFDPACDEYSLPIKLNKEDVVLSIVAKRDHLTGKLFNEWVDLKNIVADSSYLSGRLLDHRCLKDCAVLHLVRNPMEVINSFVLDGNFFTDNTLINSTALHWITHIRPYEKIMCDCVPEILEYKNPLDRAALYYMGWNEMIEKKVSGRYMRHRIESGITQDIFDFFDVKTTDNFYNNKTINSWKKRTYDHSISDLSPEIQDRLKKIMNRYGYFTQIF